MLTRDIGYKEREREEETRWKVAFTAVTQNHYAPVSVGEIGFLTGFSMCTC